MRAIVSQFLNCKFYNALKSAKVNLRLYYVNLKSLPFKKQTILNHAQMGCYSVFFLDEQHKQTDKRFYITISSYLVHDWSIHLVRLPFLSTI